MPYAIVLSDEDAELVEHGRRSQTGVAARTAAEMVGRHLDAAGWSPPCRCGDSSRRGLSHSEVVCTTDDRTITQSVIAPALSRCAICGHVADRGTGHYRSCPRYDYAAPFDDIGVGG